MGVFLLVALPPPTPVSPPAPNCIALAPALHSHLHSLPGMAGHSTPVSSNQFPDHTRVFVVPGTGAGVHPKDMEPFVGEVIRRADEDFYIAKRLAPGFRGRKIHSSRITRHTTFESTPLGEQRARYSQLNEHDKEKFREVAR